VSLTAPTFERQLQGLMIKKLLSYLNTKLDTSNVVKILAIVYKKAVLPQGNRAMPQVFFEVRQQHSLQV